MKFINIVLYYSIDFTENRELSPKRNLRTVVK